MVTVHPSRYSTSNVEQPKRLVVVHTAESGESDASLNALLAMIQTPGTNVVPGSNPPRYFGACYHAFADADTEGYIQVCDGSKGPYANGGANKFAWSICIPGRANQTREQWLDEQSRKQIKGVARFIVDRAIPDGIPLVKVNGAQMAAGAKGYCGHADVRDAWHQTDHYDPGPNFPWELLADEIAALTSPPPPNGDVMTPDRRILWDSRDFGNPIKAGTPIPLPIDGAGTHKAVTLKVAVIQPAQTGYLTFGKDERTGNDIPDVNIVEAGVAASDTTVVPLSDVLGGKGVAFSCNADAHIQVTLLAFND